MWGSVSLSRRGVLAVGLGMTTALSVAPALALVPTPRQTPGPFYPREIPLDHDNDLLQVAGQPGPARGTPAHIFGRVLTESGRPLDDVQVEVWQCDALGRYHHPADGGGADPAFQGYGRMATSADGAYRFRTIKPVPYTGRTPHIHFALSGPDFDRLTTQMYVAGEPMNARDGILRRIADPAARASVTVDLRPAEDLEGGGLAGRFDIVIGRTLMDG